jgi:hypothetical protein
MILLAELFGEAFSLLVNTSTIMLLYLDFTCWVSHFFTKTTFEMIVTKVAGEAVIFLTCISDMLVLSLWQDISYPD